MVEKESVSRREFIKKAVIAGAAIAVGAYGVSRLFTTKDEGTSGTGTDTDASTDTSPAQGVSEGGPWKWSKEGYHYISLGENVKCQICPNECIIREGGRSVCRNKVNYQGVLYTLAYGNPCAVHTDPVEKKPLFHFLPSTTAFSIATSGCNFRCLNCQNWEISQKRPEEVRFGELFPDQVVTRAEEAGCTSIAYTYTEPTAFYEYMYDTAKIAASHNIKNIWITNGSMNEPPLRDLCQYLDAANVDLKSFSEEIYHKLNSGMLEPILNTLKTLKDEGVWFEVTNLVIPTWTDDMDMISDMCHWLFNNIGPDYPLHFSRFHPDHKLLNLPPTPLETLEKAHKIATDCGLHYVYIGNVPGIKEQNTFCPSCRKTVIERKGFSLLQMHVRDGVCEFCGEPIKGVWTL